MTKVLYFHENEVPGKKNCVFRVDFVKIVNIEQLFYSLGTELEFELVPKKSWDAFLDQFREFCTNREANTVLLFDGFEAFSKSYFQLATKLTETISFAINEHYQIIQDNVNIPEGERIHDNRNVRISLVLK